MDKIEKKRKKRLIKLSFLPLKLYYQVRTLFFLGNRYSCPCCGGKFRAFSMYRTPFFLVKVCPKCASFERHRLLWLFFLEKTDLFVKKIKLLHFAPEFVFEDRFLDMPNLDYVSADLNSLMAMEKIDITEIPYKDETFDVIICSHVLEHIPDDKKAMIELFRVLKKGGWAVLQVPLDESRLVTFEDPNIVNPKDREKYFGLKDHVRVYGLDYKEKLEKTGFQVNIIKFAEKLGDSLIEKYGLMKDEDIYYCKKLIKLIR